MLKLLSYNIRFGGSGREEELARMIRQAEPDLVVLQEATKPDVVERLARAAGMNTWAARPGHSLGFMSLREIAHFDWHMSRGAKRAFLEIVLADTELRVFGVHLRAIHSNWTERRRVRELRGLLDSIKAHQNGPHVLVGDFNTLAPGELLDTGQLPFRLRPLVWLSGGYIRWETIKIMLDAGYVDGYRSLHPDERGFTFPTWNPHVRLDYIFLPATFADRLKSCEVLGEKGTPYVGATQEITARRSAAQVNASDRIAHASDHFPLLAALED